MDALNPISSVFRTHSFTGWLWRNLNSASTFAATKRPYWKWKLSTDPVRLIFDPAGSTVVRNLIRDRASAVAWVPIHNGANSTGCWQLPRAEAATLLDVADKRLRELGRGIDVVLIDQRGKRVRVGCGRSSSPDVIDGSAAATG